MDCLCSSFETLNVKAKNDYDIIEYILNLSIDNEIKERLIHLVQNDNYNDYEEIYNIMIENNIDIPPLF